MTRRRFLVGLPVAAVSLAIWAIAATHTGPGEARAAPAPGCATGNLVVWLDTNGDAAAGSVHYELELTNLSGRSCTLRGYPGVSAVDLAGRQLGNAALRNRADPVRTIALAPGGTASASLQIANTDVYPATRCRPTRAAGLRVYPPNQKASKVAPYPFRACSRSGVTYLQVRAVTKAMRP